MFCSSLISVPYRPIQVITSPLILQQPLDIIHQTNGNGIITPTASVATIQKENILQGA
jgi:hypothetical protein